MPAVLWPSPGSASPFDFVRVSSLIERVISGGQWSRDAKPTYPGAAGSIVQQNWAKTLQREAVWSTGVEIGEAKRKFRLRSSRPERISSSKQNER